MTLEHYRILYPSQFSFVVTDLTAILKAEWPEYQGVYIIDFYLFL